MNNINFYILVIFSLFFISSCQNRQNKEKDCNCIVERNEDLVGLYYYENFLDESLRLRHFDSIVNYGDTVIYKQMFRNYFLGGYSEEFLYFAMLMADKYNYASAYIDVYMLINSRNSFFTHRMTKLKHYYLLKAYKLGDASAKYALKDEFGKNTDSVRLMKYLDKLEEQLFSNDIQY